MIGCLCRLTWSWSSVRSQCPLKYKCSSQPDVINSASNWCICRQPLVSASCIDDTKCFYITVGDQTDNAVLICCATIGYCIVCWCYLAICNESFTFLSWCIVTHRPLLSIFHCCVVSWWWKTCVELLIIFYCKRYYIKQLEPNAVNAAQMAIGHASELLLRYEAPLTVALSMNSCQNTLMRHDEWWRTVRDGEITLCTIVYNWYRYVMLLGWVMRVDMRWRPVCRAVWR